MSRLTAMLLIFILPALAEAAGPLVPTDNSGSTLDFSGVGVPVLFHRVKQNYSPKVTFKVTLTHSDMPEDQVHSYRQGWEDFYFKPMNEYFGK